MEALLSLFCRSLQKLTGYINNYPDKQHRMLAKEDVKVHPRSRLGKHTKIGKGTNINGLAFIASREDAPVSIGKYCAIAHNLRIRTRNHHTGYANLQDKFQLRHYFPSLDVIKSPVVIGNNVWIADNVTILPGVQIGDGAVIGAGSVVTKSVPPFTVVAGNPARVIRQRFSEDVTRQLLEINWWDWSEEKIERNRRFFETNFQDEVELDMAEYLVD